MLGLKTTHRRVQGAELKALYNIDKLPLGHTEFALELEAPLAVANALRRAAIDEVPTYALDAEAVAIAGDEPAMTSDFVKLMIDGIPCVQAPYDGPIKFEARNDGAAPRLVYAAEMKPRALIFNPTHVIASLQPGVRLSATVHVRRGPGPGLGGAGKHQRCCLVGLRPLDVAEDLSNPDLSGFPSCLTAAPRRFRITGVLQATQGRSQEVETFLRDVVADVKERLRRAGEVKPVVEDASLVLECRETHTVGGLLEHYCRDAPYCAAVVDEGRLRFTLTAPDPAAVLRRALEAAAADLTALLDGIGAD